MRALEWGSVADWVTGIITAIGIIIAIKGNRPQLKVEHKVLTKDREVQIFITNKSNFQVDLNKIFIELYETRFSRDEVTIVGENFSGLTGRRTLGANERYSKKIALTPSLFGIQKEIFYIRYGVLYLGHQQKRNKFKRRVKFMQGKLISDVEVTEKHQDS